MGNINKKEQRRKSLEKQNRRQEQRQLVKLMLEEMREEMESPAIQLVFEFYHDVEVIYKKPA